MKEIYISPELELEQTPDVICTSGESIDESEIETAKFSLLRRG
jgi:hypothetical protein